MSDVKGGYLQTRSRSAMYQYRSEEALNAIREQKVKALYFLQRTGQLDIAEMLGLSPGPALTPEWRVYCEP